MTIVGCGGSDLLSVVVVCSNTVGFSKNVQCFIIVLNGFWNPTKGNFVLPD